MAHVEVTPPLLHIADVSTIITNRRTVKDAALAPKPGRPKQQPNVELEAACDEIAELTEAIKAQTIELSIERAS